MGKHHCCHYYRSPMVLLTQRLLSLFYLPPRCCQRYPSNFNHSSRPLRVVRLVPSRARARSSRHPAGSQSAPCASKSLRLFPEDHLQPSPRQLLFQAICRRVRCQVRTPASPASRRTVSAAPVRASVTLERAFPSTNQIPPCPPTYALSPCSPTCARSPRGF